jgi:hypothetical protein
VSHRSPIPLTVLRALIVVSWLVGLPQLALACWIGFSGLLRPSEICNLKVEDVVPSSLTLDGSGTTIFLIRRHKSLKASRIAHHVRVVDVLLEKHMVACIKGRMPHEPLLNLTTVQLRLHFTRVLTALGLGHLHLSPGGLRAGGAIGMQSSGCSLEAIQFHGRWSHQRTLIYYLRAGSLSLRLIEAEEVRARILLFASSFLEVLGEGF